jgi:hypothetical protein
LYQRVRSLIPKTRAASRLLSPVASKASSSADYSVRRTCSARGKLGLLIARGPDAEPEATALVRLIKFGMINTSMPGHETFTDQQLHDLVTYIQNLRASPAL